MNGEVFVEILKYGSPVLALSVLVITMYDKHLRNMITILTNHLSHTEKSQDETNRLLTVLVDRTERKE